jgi:hypothetical protein
MENEVLIESFLKVDEGQTDDLYSLFCSGDISDRELQDKYKNLSLTGNAIIQMENLIGKEKI